MTVQSSENASSREHIHFVTGRLAERAVRAIVQQVSDQVGFTFSIDVLPITVAALMTAKWLLRHIEIPHKASRVVVPGYLNEATSELTQTLGIQVDAGPRDIRDLPEFFGKNRGFEDNLSNFNIEIIAEINHAPRLTSEQLLKTALELRNSGADIIDIGCEPGARWLQVGDAIKLLRDSNLRVSIDSFDANEVRDACSSGAELVLSVNSENCLQAVDWGCEVVVIPDLPDDEKFFLKTINFLSQQQVPMRLDPILEPIGCGFADSLNRYWHYRKMFPQAAMMMGIGNLTELTDADSAAINVTLLGFCEELNIRSVLTTQVINWARSSVRECDLARRLVHSACQNRVPPKHIAPNLVMLRDTKLREYPAGTFEELASSIRDHNIRIFVQNHKIHLVTAGFYESHIDPFQLMQKLLDSPVGKSIDPSHAFYLGYELQKAATALLLGKQYEQDQALNWGFLTQSEDTHRLPRSKVAQRVTKRKENN